MSRRRFPLQFDAEQFLCTLPTKARVIEWPNREIIFMQGEPAGAIFYVRKGSVTITVTPPEGKAAIIGILDGGGFFGEECIAGQALRGVTAIANSDCSLFMIEKSAMLKALHDHPDFSDFFIAYVLSRNIRYEEELVEQLFDSSEKRLARILIMLARYVKEGQPKPTVPMLSHETLAQMAGTTRQKIDHAMKEFTKLGFIEYNRGVQVRGSLIQLVLSN